MQPSGSPGVIGALSAGKYLLSAVDFDQFADRCHPGARSTRGPRQRVVEPPGPDLAGGTAQSHQGRFDVAATQGDRARVGSGNAVPILPPPPNPAAVPVGYLPNGMVSQTRSRSGQSNCGSSLRVRLSSKVRVRRDGDDAVPQQSRHPRRAGFASTGPKKATSLT